MSQANPLICPARTYERILYPHDLLSFQLFNHVHLYIHLSYHQFVLFETSQHELQPASTPSTNLKICRRALMSCNQQPIYWLPKVREPSAMYMTPDLHPFF